jgi:hypothetical protein
MNIAILLLLLNKAGFCSSMEYYRCHFLTKLNEFVTWKRQKGYEVNVVSTAQTGGTSNTSIKNYIQNQYDNPETRPDYIILLGDTTGSYIIPTWYENYSNINGEGDYPYTHIAEMILLGMCL